MSATDFLNFLGTVAAEPSTTGKLVLLQSYQQNAFLRPVLYYTYEPTLNYFIKQIPTAPVGDRDLEDFTILDRLSQRKVTGAKAKTELAEAMRQLNAPSQELLGRILLRDLRIGVAEKRIRAAFPDLISEFGVMLAQPFDDKKVEHWPLLVSPKLDGMRVLIKVEPEIEKVSYFSRNGKPVTTLDHLSRPILDLGETSPYWLDAEATAGDFLTSISELRRKEGTGSSVLNLFDVLPIGLVTDESQLYRLNRLFYLLKNRPQSFDQLRYVEHQWARSKDEAIELYGSYRSRGFEGAMLKDPDAGYSLSRSKAWLKLKPTETLDLPVVDVFEGEGKYVGMLGGVVVDHRGTKVRVGSGFSDEDRKMLWAAWKTDPGSLFGRLLEVSFHEVTPDGSLRHPRAKRWRDDK